MFYRFAEVYSKKIDHEYSIKLQFEIIDVEEENFWQIEVSNGHVNVFSEATIEPEEYFVMKFDTLLRLYEGSLSPLTAFANEPNDQGEMCGLIDLKFKSNELFGPSYVRKEERLQYFINRLHRFDDFFNVTYPSKVKVGAENTRKIHAVDAIGLYSKPEGLGGNGILHVFFSIKRDEVLEQAPLEHSIYILKGSGVMVIDGEEYSIQSKEYYRINPKSKEKVLFKNYDVEPLELLYI